MFDFVEILSQKISGFFIVYDIVDSGDDLWFWRGLDFEFCESNYQESWSN